MIKEAIGVGDTEVLALEDACRQLGVETYEVEFETLQRAEKKILGLFGGSKAKVRAFIKIGPADTAFIRIPIGPMLSAKYLILHSKAAFATPITLYPVNTFVEP